MDCIEADTIEGRLYSILHNIRDVILFPLRHNYCISIGDIGDVRRAVL